MDKEQRVELQRRVNEAVSTKSRETRVYDIDLSKALKAVKEFERRAFK